MLNRLPFYLLILLFTAVATVVVVQLKGFFVKYNFFVIKEIEINGAVRTDKELIKKAYQPYIGKSIFSDIMNASVITSDPWVVKVEVERIMPDKLKVIVIEEEVLINYKLGKTCYSRTFSNNDILINCKDVRVRVIESTYNEFNNFINLYKSSNILQGKDIELKEGFFIAKNGKYMIIGSYIPDAFEKNYKVFVQKIEKRYKEIDQVDLRVKGRIYVKGVLNG